MQITNTTRWNTNDLRKLFGRCVQEVRKVEGRGENKGIEVSVKNASYHRGISGRGNINWYSMSIIISKEIDLREEEWKDRLALVFIHEYYHNLGYKSQDARHYANDWTQNISRDFVKDYQIRGKVVEPKPVRDIQMERYQKTLKYVKVYESKTKRVSGLLKKWRQKQRYYERTLVAAGKMPKVKK